MKVKQLFTLACVALPLLSACSSKPAPVQTLAPVDNAAPVKMVWMRHLISGTKIDYTKLTPAVDGQRIYVVDAKGQITSADLATGKPAWSFKFKYGISGGATTGNGYVYFPTTDGQLYAVNEQDGSVVWHANLPDQSNTAPTYSNGQVFVKTIDDEIVALNASNGQQNWSYTEGSTQLQLLGSSSAAVAGNTVVAGFSDGKLNAFDVNTGQMKWQAMVAMPIGFSDVSRMIGISADPIISGNTVYAASYHGNIAAISLSSGQILWQHALSDYAGIALDNTAVYASDSKGRVWAFDRKDGSVLWKQTALVGRQVTGPAIDNNKIVVADNQGFVHWLSPQDGHFIARTSVGNLAITMTPVATSQGVIVYIDNGTVMLFTL